MIPFNLDIKNFCKLGVFAALIAFLLIYSENSLLAVTGTCSDD